MKNIFLLAVALISLGVTSAQSGFQHVNPVLLDQSFTSLYNESPTSETDENLRIQTHLTYVLQLLNQKNPGELSTEQLNNRRLVLNLLAQYVETGIYPSNYDYPDERRPCFIDRNGRICAVGYLVEQTKGRQMAESINTKHQYDFLLDMNEPSLNDWAEEFGLTIEECAMIQPAYGPPPPNETIQKNISTEYGTASGIVGGINLGVTMINLSNKGANNRTIAYIGLVTGTTELLLGLANIHGDKTEYNFSNEVTTSYKAQNNLSYVNIAVGTTTIVTSALNLIVNKKSKSARNAYNFYSIPNHANSMTVGLSLTRKL